VKATAANPNFPYLYDEISNLNSMNLPLLSMELEDVF